MKGQPTGSTLGRRQSGQYQKVEYPMVVTGQVLHVESKGCWIREGRRTVSRVPPSTFHKARFTLFPPKKIKVGVWTIFPYGETWIDLEGGRDQRPMYPIACHYSGWDSAVMNPEQDYRNRQLYAEHIWLSARKECIGSQSCITADLPVLAAASSVTIGSPNIGERAGSVLRIYLEPTGLIQHPGKGIYVRFSLYGGGSGDLQVDFKAPWNKWFEVGLLCPTMEEIGLLKPDANGLRLSWVRLYPVCGGTFGNDFTAHYWMFSGGAAGFIVTNPAEGHDD